MKTITEISKFKFLEMAAFVEGYKKVNGRIPEKEDLFKRFGEVRTKLFLNIWIAYNNGTFNIDTLVRATLRDDGIIEYKYFRK